MTDLQAQAREILAAQCDIYGAPVAARNIRAGKFSLVSGGRTIRAFLAALQSRADEVERLREALEAWLKEFDPAAYVEDDLADSKYADAARLTNTALSRTGGE